MKIQPFYRQLAIPLLWSLLLAAPTFADKLYKWTDAEGRVHYSDKPPPQHARNSSEISTKLKPLNNSQASRETARMRQIFPEQSAEEKAYRNQKKRLSQQQRKERELACQKARKALNILRGPVIFLDDQGRSLTVSEVERAQRAKALEKQIAANCAPTSE